MKVLVIDIDRAGVDIAVRAQWAGHDVKHYISPRQGKALRPNVGRGLTHLVSDWRPHMKWADLIITTGSSTYGAEMEEYFREGYPIFGSNKAAAAWELDRCVGMEIFVEHGIPVPEYEKFSDYDSAIAYIKATGQSYVCKPLGMADRALSYVGKGPADLVAQLQRFKKLNGRPSQPFILQEKCEGTEVAVAGWFGKNGWIGPWEENFEHKKLFAGDMGINTGEMGTVMKYVDKSALAEKALVPFTNALHALNFIGNIDVNLIVDEKGNCWPLEFTMRLGWPAFYLHTHMHKGDPVEWMRGLIDGEDKLRVDYDICTGVCVIAPTFPACVADHKDVEGIPIFGINQKNIANIHLMEVMAGKAEVFDGDWEQQELFMTAGDWLLTVCGTGKNVRESREEAYGVIDQLIIPNSPAHRHDIGERLEKALPLLKAHGYCKDWRF